MLQRDAIHKKPVDGLNKFRRRVALTFATFVLVVRGTRQCGPQAGPKSTIHYKIDISITVKDDSKFASFFVIY